MSSSPALTRHDILRHQSFSSRMSQISTKLARSYGLDRLPAFEPIDLLVSTFYYISLVAVLLNDGKVVYDHQLFPDGSISLVDRRGKKKYFTADEVNEVIKKNLAHV